MAFDIAKYRALFLEEGAEHLSEISAALLELEKDSESVDAIDVIFRMAHSMKSMAASLGYDSITEVAHRLEDRMQTIRSAARVADAAELQVLFVGLQDLEQMVEVVASTGEAPAVVSEPTESATDASPQVAREGGPLKKG